VLDSKQSESPLPLPTKNKIFYKEKALMLLLLPTPHNRVKEHDYHNSGRRGSVGHLPF